MLLSPQFFILVLYISIFFGFSLIAYMNSFILRGIYENIEVNKIDCKKD